MENSIVFPPECAICDTDVWVRVCHAGIQDLFITAHPKLFFADVVEGEILKWESNGEFSNIASEFKRYKELERIHVISHEIHIPHEDRAILEYQLSELGFAQNFKNRPTEDNKGEYVSAIYADYFNIPIMKTDDGAFSEAGPGRKAFPKLTIHNWYDITEKMFPNNQERIKVRTMAETQAKKMNAAKAKFKAQREAEKEIDLADKIEQLRKKYSK